jgi:nitrite reductase/ring-hydroxylating ferredoxin subunit
MSRDIARVEAGPSGRPGACPGCGSEPSRRELFARASCALAAALAASGVSVDAARAYPVDLTNPVSEQGAERSYPLPAEDGVSIDQDNEVILVRSANRVYAFALACPHENTALRWRQNDRRFQCPRHESKYQPDGTFTSGRATRNMDRFAIRRDGQRVIVDLAKLWRSDKEKAAWDAAVLTL